MTWANAIDAAWQPGWSWEWHSSVTLLEESADRLQRKLRVLKDLKYKAGTSATKGSKVSVQCFSNWFTSELLDALQAVEDTLRPPSLWTRNGPSVSPNWLLIQGTNECEALSMILKGSGFRHSPEQAHNYSCGDWGVDEGDTAAKHLQYFFESLN